MCPGQGENVEHGKNGRRVWWELSHTLSHPTVESGQGGESGSGHGNADEVKTQQYLPREHVHSFGARNQWQGTCLAQDIPDSIHKHPMQFSEPHQEGSLNTESGVIPERHGCDPNTEINKWNKECPR